MGKKIDLYNMALNNPDSYLGSIPNFINAYYRKSRKRIPNIAPLTHLIINAAKNDQMKYRNLVTDFAEALLNQKQNYEAELELCDKFIIKNYMSNTHNSPIHVYYSSQMGIINYLVKTNLRPTVYGNFIYRADDHDLSILFINYWSHMFKDDKTLNKDKEISFYLNCTNVWNNAQFFDLRLNILQSSISHNIMDKLAERTNNHVDLFYYGMSDDHKLGILL